LRRRPRRTDHPDALDDEQVARLWQHTAETYRKANQPDQAIQVYQQAIKWDPDNLSVRLALAEDLLAGDRLDAAQSELQRVLKRNKKHIPALLRMGEVLFHSDQWWVREEAPHYWKRILKLESDHFQARQALADYYRDQAEIDYSWDRFGKAIKDYKEAMKYQPNHAPTLAAIANCYIQDDDSDSAQPYIEQAIGLATKKEYVFSEIIGAWILVEDFDRALELMRQAEESIEPVPVDFYLVHAAQLFEMEQTEDAAIWLDSAIEHAPSGQPVLLMIGEMAMDYDEQLARRYLEQAVAEEQSTGQAHLLLGILADHEGDQRESRRHWRQAGHIARKTRDTELKERLEFARFMAGGPQAVIERLFNLGGPEAVEDFLSFMGEDFYE
ncbi:MAG: tetratricopeptide repeat protein, partial [Chloroflexi bacterium]|nr:tetratricopeptide repeat protein [Chloroflexota bacterium]